MSGATASQCVNTLRAVAKENIKQYLAVGPYSQADYGAYQIYQRVLSIIEHYEEQEKESDDGPYL